MGRKSLKVDRRKFEGIVQSLLQSKPMKREKVKVAKKKPAKLIPPHKPMPEETKYAKDKRLRVEKLLERIETKGKQGKKKKPAKLIPPQK